MKYPHLGKRFLALLIDGLVLAIPNIILNFVFPVIISTILVGSVYFAYFVYMNGKYGQTIGKMLMKMKIVRLDGSAIDFKDAFYRLSVNLVLYFLGFMSIIFSISGNLIGVVDVAWGVASIISVFLIAKKRALHDLIAKTVVVVDEKESEILSKVKEEISS